MMVYISIYEESTKCVKRKCVIEVFREGIRAINGKKMSSADDGIKMNNCSAAAITHKLWFHDPETCLRIRFVTAEDQPVDKRTWIISTVK